MEILKLVSFLLDYPTVSLVDNREAIDEFIGYSANLTQEQRNTLKRFVEHQCSVDLLELQAQYDGLFERGRSLSLLIYEHMHGESRDRGQAMVDLMAQYKKAGLDIGVRELPDYIPLYLEFASTQAELAKDWLLDIVPVLSLLAVRLEQRQSQYAELMYLLVQLSGARVDYIALKQQIQNEKRDDTPKALDKVWEEEAVTFGADNMKGNCPSSSYRPTEQQRRDQVMPLQGLESAYQPILRKQ